MAPKPIDQEEVLEDPEDLAEDDEPRQTGTLYITRAGRREAARRAQAPPHRGAPQGHRRGVVRGLAGRSLGERRVHLRQEAPARDRSPPALPRQAAREAHRGRARHPARTPARCSSAPPWPWRTKKTGRQVSYQLVGPDETDLKTGKISVDSPVGRALLGKRQGDVVTVNRPRGESRLLHRGHQIRMRSDAGACFSASPSASSSPLPPGAILARKNFVLDTNVLLHDPRSIYSFDDNTVIVPIYVIEELDMFKKDMSELGRNARQVARYLDTHRKEGTLAEGVPLPNGGMLKVVLRRARSAQVDGRRAADGQPHPRGRHRDAAARPEQPDGVHHQGHQPAHSRRRPGAHLRGLRARAGRDQRSLHRHQRAAGLRGDHQPALQARRPGHHSRPRQAGAQRVRALQGRGEPLAHRDGPLRRRQAGRGRRSTAR